MTTMREIRILRRKLKISLLELAAHTGLPEGYLDQIEQGQISASESDLKRIYKALKTIETTTDSEKDVFEL